MAKVVVTFKLEEGIYSKLRDIARGEGRGISKTGAVRVASSELRKLRCVRA